MECQDCIDALTALLDAELSPFEERELEDHLSVCSACKKEYDSLLTAFRLTEGIRTLELGPAIWERVRSQVESSSSSRSEVFFGHLRSYVGRFWLPVTAACLLLMLSLPLSDDKPDVEKEFGTFIEMREKISSENMKKLFDTPESYRDYREWNPFVKPVAYEKQNPFRE